MRRAFADTLVQLGRARPDVIFLTGDLGFQVFDQFEAEFPSRYINVGVAEAQLVDCAAGLALEGWRPIVYSIASFMTGRAFEQIRIAVGYHDLPVVVVGAGGGFTYASSGVSHHAREDAALMTLIPGMTVVIPGAPHEVTALLPQLFDIDGPSYIRIGRFGEPDFESPTTIRLGRARLLRRGSGLAILTTGGAAVDGLAAAERLVEEGLDPVVCHFHTLRPFDEDALEALADSVTSLVVVEDHAPLGGLATAVSDWVARSGRRLDLHRLGPGEDLVLGNPSQSDLKESYGGDAESIVACCLRLSPRGVKAHGM